MQLKMRTHKVSGHPTNYDIFYFSPYITIKSSDDYGDDDGIRTDDQSFGSDSEFPLDDPQIMRVDKHTGKVARTCFSASAKHFFLSRFEKELKFTIKTTTITKDQVENA